MTVSYLNYAIENGYIHNWLVAGPQAILVADLDRYTGTDYKLQIARHYYERERGAGIVETPAETQPVAVGDFNGKWEYVRCKDDHFVDLSTFHHICHYLRAWAYAQVVSRKMLAMPLEFGDLSVKLKSLPGDSLEFGWTGPLMLNGQVQPVTGFKHIENPYCEADLPAMQMEIRFQDTLLRLKFEKA